MCTTAAQLLDVIENANGVLVDDDARRFAGEALEMGHMPAAAPRVAHGSGGSAGVRPGGPAHGGSVPVHDGANDDDAFDDAVLS